MSKRKERLTVTVDPAWVAAGNEAVAAGRAESLSAWVDRALAERVTRERRLTALGEAIAAHEARLGTISTRELADQARNDRVSAVVVRGPAAAAGRKRRRGGVA